MKATYFEPQIELVRFDCTDIVATSSTPPSFASFFLKPINAASEGTSSVPTASGELDAF